VIHTSAEIDRYRKRKLHRVTAIIMHHNQNAESARYSYQLRGGDSDARMVQFCVATSSVGSISHYVLSVRMSWGPGSTSVTYRNPEAGR
jgi:hypothetical protein